MLTREIIRKKRDGGRLPADEIRHLVAGMTSGAVSEGQVAAFAMAVFFRGLEPEEGVALTLAMRDSGTVLDWSDLPGPVTDKHSTGGVGDNVSLMLAPIVAACGDYVPMISGRGLGHTGGTLDKMDSIPGYRSQPDNALFRACVKETGCAIIGQTGDLAPADKRFYAIRDVTATVESIPLITASILSKKLAAGLQSLVLDVKVGSGAFMDDLAKARELAISLVEVANGAGLRTTALLTDMDHPLASSAGNAVEMRNAVDFLTGRARDAALYEITVALGADMLVSGGIAHDAADGGKRMAEAFSSGAAAERFAQMVCALGGPSDFIERMDAYLETPPVHRPLMAAPEHKCLAGKLGFNTRQIGLAVVELGGGRTRPQDPVDHAVGLTAIAGREWDGESPLCEIHARDDAAADRAAARILAALREADTPGDSVIERITA